MYACVYCVYDNNNVVANIIANFQLKANKTFYTVIVD